MNMIDKQACPSELKRDQYRYNELQGADKKAIEEHLELCTSCQAWMEKVSIQEEQLANEIKILNFAQVADSKKQRKHSKRNFAELLLHYFAKPQAYLVILIASFSGITAVKHLSDLSTSSNSTYQNIGGSENDHIRIKGSSKLSIHLKRGELIKEVKDRDTVKSGDMIRISISPLKETYLFILSVQDGKRSAYFPYDGNKSARVSPQKKFTLPHSIILDGSKDETIYAILSNRQLTRAEAWKSIDRKDSEISILSKTLKR